MERVEYGSAAERESPGGKSCPGSNENFDEGSYQELAVQPRPGSLGIEFLQIPHSENRLESLEHQLHLPTAAVDFHYRLGRKAVMEGGEDYHVLGSFQCLGLDSSPLFAVFL